MLKMLINNYAFYPDFKRSKERAQVVHARGNARPAKIFHSNVNCGLSAHAKRVKRPKTEKRVKADGERKKKEKKKFPS